MIEKIDSEKLIAEAKELKIPYNLEPAYLDAAMTIKINEIIEKLNELFPD